MIVFRGGGAGGGRGCTAIGCLPLLAIAILITVVVFALSGGHVFFFAIYPMDPWGVR